MSFQVNPDTAASYGSLVERNSINLARANSHLLEHMQLGSTDGALMQMLVGPHDQTVTRISDSINRGFNTMEDSSEELKRTADYYRRTDQRSATELDGTYPASARPAVDPPNPYKPPVMDGRAGPAQSNAATDVADPRQYLTVPARPEEFTDPVKLFNVVSDFLSPTWWMNQVLSDTIGLNPLEFVTDIFIGDWEGFARCALLWDNLSKATGAIGENVRYGLAWLAADWQGQAADAAVHYFDYTRQALDSHRDVLHRLHEKYLDVARGLWNCARAVADTLKAILDNVIVAGLAVLAGVLTSWTGVGAAISWGFAAYECYRILKLWGDATKLISAAQAIVEGFVGALQSKEAGTLDEIRPIPLPATDYQHPNPEIKPEPTSSRDRQETP